MDDKKTAIRKQIEQAQALIEAHSTTEPEESRHKEWPQTWKCRCGAELTAINFGSMQHNFVFHLVLQALAATPPGGSPQRRCSLCKGTGEMPGCIENREMEELMGATPAAPRETVKAEGLRDKWLAHLVSRWLLDIRSGHYEPDEQTAKGIIDEVRDHDAKALAAQAVRPAPEALQEQIAAQFPCSLAYCKNVLEGSMVECNNCKIARKIRALRLGSQPATQGEQK